MSSEQSGIAPQDLDQQTLARMYQAKQRPQCPCRVPHLDMYIAKIADQFYVKRMPNSGPLHDPSCDSFESPPELSGLGEVLGSAIKEQEEGVTELKFAFSMSRTGQRTAPTPSGGEKDSVKSDGSKLTLRSTLHYLLEQAGFNKWAPGMVGKRSWSVFRKYLLTAAADKVVKGEGFWEKLYIPEKFDLDQLDAIKRRRSSHLSKIVSVHKGPRQLMVLIGEIKEITTARYGFKIVCRHLSDMPFMLTEDIHQRLVKRFFNEIQLWNSIEKSHLVLIGTFGLSSNGVANIEEASLVLLDENWIPIESVSEHLLLTELYKGDRRFVKCLRYNLPSSRPLASVLLTDTQPQSTALYLIPADCDEELRDAYNELIQSSLLPSWQWELAGEMPPILLAGTSGSPESTSTEERNHSHV